MSDTAFQRLKNFTQIFHHCSVDPSCNHTNLTYHNTNVVYDLDLPGDGTLWLRTTITVVYCIVSVTGLLGNLLVLHLVRSARSNSKSTINCFVFNLAVADLLFSLALTFWAVDMAMDYSWPFGWCMCKAVSLLTTLNNYASTFFLTAMSVARYCSVANALKSATPLSRKLCVTRFAIALIWAGALFAAMPRAVFATVIDVGGDSTCLLQFPDGTAWLGVNHLLKVVLGFLLPYVVIMLSYLLLLRFLCRHKLSGVNPRRQAHVSKSVAIVVLSFCACWFPYNLITVWSILIQLDVLEFTPSFYFTQTYVFPVANCLAFVSSCLNPILYCLICREYRKALQGLLRRSTLASASKACFSLVSSGDGNAVEQQLAIPLNNMESHTVQSCTKRSTPPSTTLSIAPSPKR